MLAPIATYRNRLARWILVFLLLGVPAIGLTDVFVSPIIGAPRWALFAAGAAWIGGVLLSSRAFPLRVSFEADTLVLRFVHRVLEIPYSEIARVNYRAEKSHYESRQGANRGFTVEIARIGHKTLWITCDGHISMRLMERFPGSVILSRWGAPVEEIPVRRVTDRLSDQLEDGES